MWFRHFFPIQQRNILKHRFGHLIHYFNKSIDLLIKKTEYQFFGQTNKDSLFLKEVGISYTFNINGYPYSAPLKKRILELKFKYII